MVNRQVSQLRLFLDYYTFPFDWIDLMHFEDLVINQFVIVAIYVQLPRPVLQLVDAPLNLAEVLLRQRFENTHGFENV